MMRSRSKSPRLPSPPDLAAAIVGWRVWRVDTRYRLCSALRDEPWEARHPFSASCVSGHGAPDESCTCGIHAVRAPEEARPYLIGRNSPEAVHRVLGRVSLWGRVVEGPAGWRAEYGYPAQLWVPDDPLASEIALHLGRYAVPVELVGARHAADVIEAALAA